jgi:hypothetical protein
MVIRLFNMKSIKQVILLVLSMALVAVGELIAPMERVGLFTLL